MSKLQKLLQLHRTYAAAVEAAEVAAARESDAEEEDEADAEERAYLARMEAGSYTLQLVDVCLCYAATAKNKQLRQQVLHGLYEDGFSLHDIWANAFDHIKSFGIDTVDAVQRKQTEELGKEVEKLLQKYTTVKEEGADAEAEQE